VPNNTGRPERTCRNTSVPPGQVTHSASDAAIGSDEENAEHAPTGQPAQSELMLRVVRKLWSRYLKMPRIPSGNYRVRPDLLCQLCGTPGGLNQERASWHPDSLRFAGGKQRCR